MPLPSLDVPRLNLAQDVVDVALDMPLQAATPSLVVPPRYGWILDDGRAFYSRAWLMQLIRELSDLKLNLLHLHFSDDQGFRIESTSHPEAVSDFHLTKKVVRSLVALGKRYRVKLVPELDMPGHMQAALTKHPELQLADASGQRAPDKLDYTKPEARRFARELIEEYMALFPASEWHMGADEFLSVILPPTPADYARYPQLEAYAKATYGPAANANKYVGSGSVSRN